MTTTTVAAAVAAVHCANSVWTELGIAANSTQWQQLHYWVIVNYTEQQHCSATLKRERERRRKQFLTGHENWDDAGTRCPHRYLTLRTYISVGKAFLSRAYIELCILYSIIAGMALS